MTSRPPEWRIERAGVAGEPVLCGLCGKPATGLAYVGDVRYCHGDGEPDPTCYMRACWDQPFEKWLAVSFTEPRRKP